MPVVTDQAFVTLATNDAYCQGALVLCQSLKHHKTTRRVVVLFTPQVSSKMRRALECLFDEAIEVNVLDSGDSAHLALLSRPELGITFTKIHCWCLVQYSKCVFMDADTLVCQNVDDLFEREELSAAPDPGWPDCFNTGLFVYKPSIETYNRLLEFAVENGSFDGGDQGLLNSFFSNWSTTDIHKHLPFIYNLAGIALYSYLPAFKRFGASVKVVHFLGPTKPWHHRYHVETKSVAQENMSPLDSMFINFLNTWWAIYTTFILPLLAQVNGEKREIHEPPRVEDRQVIMRRQEEIGAIGKAPPSSKAEKRKKIEKRDTTSLLTKGYTIADKHSAKVREQNVPFATEPSTSTMKTKSDKTLSEDASSKDKRDETLLAPSSTKETRNLFIICFDSPYHKAPPGNLILGKETLSSTSEKEGKETLSSTSEKEQPVFADKVGQRSAPFLAALNTSTMEMEKETSFPAPEQTTKIGKILSLHPPPQKDVTDSFSELSLDTAPADPDQAQDRSRWEEGNMDYMGKDAFVNIQKKLDRFLK